MHVINSIDIYIYIYISTLLQIRSFEAPINEHYHKLNPTLFGLHIDELETYSYEIYGDSPCSF